MSLLVDDIRALVERVGGPVDVVGHDWGAVVGWALAATRPDLVRTLTAASVPHPAAFMQAMLTSKQEVKSRYMLVFQLPFLPERWARNPGRRFDREFRNGGMTADDVARFRREIGEDGALHYALMWYRAMPLTDPRRGAGVVRVPTIYAVAAALLFVLFGSTPPAVVMRPIEMLSNASLPLMILVLGMQLERAALPDRPVVVVAAVVVSLLLTPLAAFGIASALGMTGPAFQAAMIQSSMPAAVVTTILALQYETAPNFVTSVVLATTVLSRSR